MEMPKLMNKKLANIGPYSAIFVVFVIYMQYWSEIVMQCTSFCVRGYDDRPYYHDFLGLLNGSWPGDIAFYQSPLPGFYLGLTHIIFRHPVDNLAIPYLIQIFIATLTSALAYKLGQEMFSRYVGLVTILLLGFYPFVKFYATTIETNTLIACFLTATLYFLVKYKTNQNKIFLVIASICLGLSILGRTNNLVIIGAIALWLILSKDSLKNLVVDLGLLLFITFLTLLPASIHTSLAAGKFALVTTTGVYNFTMGNLPDSPGYYTDIAVQSLEPSLKFITEQPVDWLLLTIQKFRLFFTFPWSPTWLHELPLYFVIPWGIIAVLYFFYFFKTFSPQRSLLHFSLIFYAASIIITHVEDEYRIPILPVLFIFAAATFVSIATQLHKLGLKVYNSLSRWQVRKPALVLSYSLLVIMAFIAYAPSSKISYKVDYIESDAVHSGIIVGQNFQIDCPNLNQIGVNMFALNPDKSITFHLKENSIDGPELYSQVINTSQLKSFAYHSIIFPEISNSAGKNYTFYFDTANLNSAEQGVFFTGGLHPFAESLNRIDAAKKITGGAFVKQDSLDNLPGNLSFFAYCKAHRWQLIQTAINHLAAKTPFSQIVGFLLSATFIVHCIALLVSAVFVVYKVYNGHRNTK